MITRVIIQRTIYQYLDLYFCSILMLSAHDSLQSLLISSVKQHDSSLSGGRYDSGPLDHNNGLPGRTVSYLNHVATYAEMYVNVLMFLFRISYCNETFLLNKTCLSLSLSLTQSLTKSFTCILGLLGNMTYQQKRPKA